MTFTSSYTEGLIQQSEYHYGTPDMSLSGSFSGSFQGDGSDLTNIPATGIVGLNLSQIASGSSTASISPNGGLFVNTHITASGNISASGEVRGANLYTVGTLTAEHIISTDDMVVTDDLTVNGNISGSNLSQIHASIYNVDGAQFANMNGGTFQLASSATVTQIDLGKSNAAVPVFINGAVTCSTDISSSGTGSFKKLEIYGIGSGGSSGFICDDAGTGDLTFGIGKTNPLYTLDVLGTVNATRLYGNGSGITDLQRPISSSVSTHVTASDLNAGYYFRAGGNITCSIQANSTVACAVGSEFDFFQTSSAGNVLFLSGSGVTLNTKGGFTKLDGQFAGATLKKVDTDEWDLVGDLNS